MKNKAERMKFFDLGNVSLFTLGLLFGNSMTNEIVWAFVFLAWCLFLISKFFFDSDETQ